MQRRAACLPLLLVLALGGCGDGELEDHLRRAGAKDLGVAEAELDLSCGPPLSLGGRIELGCEAFARGKTADYACFVEQRCLPSASLCWLRTVRDSGCAPKPAPSAGP